ncbi:hypothetical protein BJY04DRAFT_194555 [Aspergillus karnatakaensis]|uniref:DUF3425 domain-containing protein n=1 Tax=Aspergillus karnatakaensis TaxID=1810916 RepID=UPI003CCD42D0
MPTETQMRKIHATWINILPFPRMRENLIRREREFDHVEFIRDLVGLHVGFDTGKFFSLPSATGVGEKGASSQVQVVVEHEENDGVTDGRHGLILWDEPHRVESWEATPGFLRKWMWTLEGCEELIESSNRWRRVRGEEPIRVVMQETKK